MASRFSLRQIFLALAAAILSAIPGLALAYIVGVVVIAFSLRDLAATLLAALTALPLMLIFVGIPVSLVIGVLSGLVLGLGSILRGRPLGIVIGAAIGGVCSAVILSLIVPLLASAQRGDFLDIATRLYVSASYGVVIGAIASRLFRWMDS